jgi:tRNA/tmRNA/rRNA uracil-C5-methylase (TrmA/RlmC/RlmD family)
MLEMAAAAGAIDLYYADESGCCQWTPVSYSYYFEGEQKRQEQIMRKRGKRLSDAAKTCGNPKSPSALQLSAPEDFQERRLHLLDARTQRQAEPSTVVRKPSA